MKKNSFKYRTHCELAIISNGISFDLIAEELQVIPNRFYKKGEQTKSKHSGSVITKQHNLWAITSKITEIEEETISHHIEYFRSFLLTKLDILKKYKEDSRYEVIFWIWIETDNSGVGIDLNESEIAFLNSISNRVHFSIISDTSKDI